VPDHEYTQAVTAEEALTAMRKYILPLFDPQTSVAFVVCGPNQVQEVATGYKEAGYEVEVREMDDKVPWADEENKMGTKALKWLSKALSAGEALAHRAQELLHLS
jgi:hypothetical protein